MLHFDQHLLELVRSGTIDEQVALSNASSPTDLSLKLKGF
jgi:Tfp pilus assembly ATPase PilU